MTNLIPEQRLDRNGKLVTKHVRAIPKQGVTRSKLPAPSAAPKGKSKTTKKQYKPLPRQLETVHRSFRFASFPANDPLTTQEQRDKNLYQGGYTNFSASDAEMYDVLSATTSQGDALEIMARGGVRSAKEARAYLKKKKAPELIADRSELMTAAFERGMSAEAFLNGYDLLKDDEKESPHFLDAVEFKNSALNYNYNAFVLDHIVNGDVAFSDLKAIGLSRLKPHARAYALTRMLTKLNHGEADYTIDDVKAFVIRAAEAKTDDRSFKYAANFAVRKGFELLQDKQDFELINQQSYHFLAATSPFRRKHEDEDEELSYDRIEYGVRMGKLLTGFSYSGSSTPFFEAGVPPEIAANVVNSGGGIREAMAVHQDDIQTSVSGGWL
jgi:hypothetical protein